MADPAPPGDDMVDLAHTLAEAARQVTRRDFRAAVAVDDKSDATPVTIADREAESAMREAIAAACPGHGIVGEEFGTQDGDADFVWVLDPIDGTKQFITGKPTFGTLIALLHHRRPVLGVIDMPILGERWVGVMGRRTLHIDDQGATQVTTRPCEALERATLCTTAPELHAGRAAPSFQRLRAAVRVTVYGGDCHNYGLLASGFCDIATDGSMSPYDYAALIPVVEGAGGRITDFAGMPLAPLDASGGERQVLAVGDPALHAAVLDALAG